MKAQSLPSGSSESVSLCVSGGACELRAAPGSSPKALHLGLVLLVLEGSEKMGGAGQCSLEGTPGKWNSPALPGRTSGVSDHVATQPGRGRGLLGPGSAGLCGAVWSHRPKGCGTVLLFKKTFIIFHYKSSTCLSFAFETYRKL